MHPGARPDFDLCHCHAGQVEEGGRDGGLTDSWRRDMLDGRRAGGHAGGLEGMLEERKGAAG